MCGLIGKIGNRVSSDSLRRGGEWIRRRGPDSQKLWSTDDDCIALYQARLAIVDRDPRSDQPLTDSGRKVTVAMVGEVYNYRALKKMEKEYCFRTRSDTEVFLSLYLKHGIDGLRYIKGMYTAVLVDEPAKRIYLARDPVGKKPLFVYRFGSTILFGSSILALLSATGTTPDLRQDAIEDFWNDGFVRPDTCLFREMKPVLPGQVLEFDWQGKLVATHRCDPAPEVLYDGESSADISANVTHLLEQSIERRLENNPDPTVLLSGGIDSTVVTKIAHNSVGRDNDPGNLRALTLGAWIPGTQDELYARYAAYKCRVPLTTIRLNGSVEDAVMQSLDLQDEPLGMISFFLLTRLIAAAAEHGRVLLTGDGGDEVFLGYRPVKDWLATSQDDTRGIDESITVGPMLPSWMSKWGRESATVSLLGHMFTKSDRASAEQGVEIRCPLLDWDVMSYARSLPFEALAHDDVNKALLKSNLAGWPAWFIERRKLGFAYNLRWFWLMSGYSNLRDLIDTRAVETFDKYLPADINKNPASWRSRDIFQNFNAVWKLLVWSSFKSKLDKISI